MNTTRDAVVEYIRKNPFCTKKQIANYLDVTVGAVNYHLKYIKVVHSNLSRTFKRSKFKPIDQYHFIGVRAPSKTKF